MQKRVIGAMICWCAIGCDPSALNPCATTGTGTQCEETTAFEACLQSRFLSDPAAEAAVTLLEIPAALQAVLDNREAFTFDTHPLQDIEPGTVFDLFGLLDGCWGRVEVEQYADGSGAWVEAAALTVDQSAGTFNLERMIGVDGFACATDTRASVIAFEHRIDTSTPGVLELTILGDLEADRTTAGIDNDGSLSFHLHARTGWELSIGNAFTKLYTVTGNYLVTDRTSSVATTSGVDLWIRLDCPE